MRPSVTWSPPDGLEAKFFGQLDCREKAIPTGGSGARSLAGRRPQKIQAGSRKSSSASHPFGRSGPAAASGTIVPNVFSKTLFSNCRMTDMLCRRRGYVRTANRPLTTSSEAPGEPAWREKDRCLKDPHTIAAISCATPP